MSWFFSEILSKISLDIPPGVSPEMYPVNFSWNNLIHPDFFLWNCSFIFYKNCSRNSSTEYLRICFWNFSPSENFQEFLPLICRGIFESTPMICYRKYSNDANDDHAQNLTKFWSYSCESIRNPGISSEITAGIILNINMDFPEIYNSSRLPSSISCEISGKSV